MKKLKNNKLTVVDLFCGAGIGALGIKYSGCNIIYAIDNNKYAVETYNKNIKNVAKLKDIKKIDVKEIPNSDILIATPVCKSFSVAGLGEGEKNKEVGDLTFYFLEILKNKMPKAFLFENVSGMCNKNHSEFFEKILKEMKNIGYKLSINLIDCYDYGIPQHRKRLFIIGIRNDIKKDFKFPEKILDKDKVSIRDFIKDLKEPSFIINSKKEIYYTNNEIKEQNIKNHYGYGIRKDEQSFVEKIPIGGNWKNLEKKDKKLFMKGAYNSGGGRTGFLRKVSMDNPSFCITSTITGKNNAQIIDIKDKYGYYIEGYIKNRRFSVRECLRLQTVLDEFYFEDNIPLLKQYERCSGIPSLMSYKIMLNIIKVLKNVK